MLGADGVGGAGALLLRAAVLRVLRVALRLTVALLGPALLLSALLRRLTPISSAAAQGRSSFIKGRSAIAYSSRLRPSNAPSCGS